MAVNEIMAGPAQQNHVPRIATQFRVPGLQTDVVGVYPASVKAERAAAAAFVSDPHDSPGLFIVVALGYPFFGDGP